MERTLLVGGVVREGILSSAVKVKLLPGCYMTPSLALSPTSPLVCFYLP